MFSIFLRSESDKPQIIGRNSLDLILEELRKVSLENNLRIWEKERDILTKTI